MDDIVERCPFCDGPAKATPDGASWPLVVCTPCGAYVEATSASDDPVPRWNKRPMIDRQREEIGRLRAEQDAHGADMFVAGMNHALSLIKQDAERIEREHAEIHAALSDTTRGK